jgi:uncharacterized membrane protein YphA (DoxX/SURF4 family)
MNLRGELFTRIDIKVTEWMSRNGLPILRISVGLIFVWFGGLKFVEGMSPAQDLAIRTIQQLSFNLVPEKTIIIGLAIWEVAIGIGLIFKLFLRETLLLLFLQMLGTFTPVFLFPSEVFVQFPLALTLEGQYIFKNLVIVGAAIVLGATVRGGRLTVT